MTTATLSCGQRSSDGNTTTPTPQPGQTAASPIPWQTIEPPTQVGLPAGTPKPPQPAVFRTYSGVGVIRDINLKEGWVEVEHDDIEGVMPAMKMIWSVKDKAMLKPIRVGDKVNFKVQDNNGSELITELTKTTTGR